MKDVPSDELPTYSIVHGDSVIPGFTREQSAEMAEKALDEWVVALAMRWAQEDHIEHR
jgi:protoheme ferro-lyase